MSNSESTIEELKEQLRQEKIKNHDLQEKVYSLSEEVNSMRYTIADLRVKIADLRRNS